MSNIEFYDIITHRVGGFGGSNSSILQIAFALKELGYTVYAGANDLIMADMKHLAFGWFSEMNWTVEFEKDKNNVYPQITFFNENRIEDPEYRDNLFGIETAARKKSALIATPCTVRFLQNYGAFDCEDMLASTGVVVLVCEWDGKIPSRGHLFMSNRLCPDTTIRDITQDEIPTPTFLEMFEYGTIIIAAGTGTDPVDPMMLSTVSAIHTATTGKKNDSFNWKTDKELCMCFDVKTDTLLIRENDPKHFV